MDMGLEHCTVCLFTSSQLSLVLIAPTHEGIARLSWPDGMNEILNLEPLGIFLDDDDDDERMNFNVA